MDGFQRMMPKASAGCIGWLLLALFGAISAVLWYPVLLQQSPILDFPLYAKAAQRFWAGELIYLANEPLAETFFPGAMVFKMTPFYLLPFIAMEWVGYGDAARWVMGCAQLMALLLLGLSLWLLLQRGRERYEKLALAAGLLVLLLWWQPALWGYLWSSAELWLCALVALSYCWLRTRPLAAGVLLAVATALKLYPVLLLVIPLCLGYWRVLLGFVLGLLASVLLCVLVFPGWMLEFYALRLLPVLLQEPLSVNIVLPWRLHFGNFNWYRAWLALSNSETANMLWFNGIRVVLLALSAALLWWRRAWLRARSDGVLLAALLVQPLLLLYLPNVYFGYFVWLLLPVAYWLLAAGLRAWQWGLCAFAVLLLLLPEAWILQPLPQALQRVSEEQLTQWVNQRGMWVAMWQFEPRLCWGLLIYAGVPWLAPILWLAAAIRLLRQPEQIGATVTP